MPNWGYYQTCWTPWPWQHNWNHCPVPPPASMVHPGLPTADFGNTGRYQQDPTMPMPRTIERPGL